MDWLRERMGARYEVKLRGRAGPAKQGNKSTRIPNRVVEWAEEGIEYVADPKHTELIVSSLGVQESRKAVFTPGCEGEERPEDFIPFGNRLPPHTEL